MGSAPFSFSLSDGFRKVLKFCYQLKLDTTLLALGFFISAIANQFSALLTFFIASIANMTDITDIRAGIYLYSEKKTTNEKYSQNFLKKKVISIKSRLTKFFEFYLDLPVRLLNLMRKHREGDIIQNIRTLPIRGSMILRVMYIIISFITIHLYDSILTDNSGYQKIILITSAFFIFPYFDMSILVRSKKIKYLLYFFLLFLVLSIMLGLPIFLLGLVVSKIIFVISFGSIILVAIVVYFIKKFILIRNDRKKFEKLIIPTTISKSKLIEILSLFKSQRYKEEVIKKINEESINLMGSWPDNELPPFREQIYTILAQIEERVLGLN